MESIKKAHSQEFGVKPEVVTVAPGRFHLIGEHTWFSKDKTLSMAVNLPVYVSISKRKDNVLHFTYPQVGESKKSNTSALKFKKEDRWANAVKSVLHGFQTSGIELPGMDILVYSDTLPSAGFGITTAIKVATAFAVAKVTGCSMDEETIVQMIARSSKQFLQSPVYKADLWTSVYSKKGCMLLTDYAKNTWENIPIPFENKKILLTDAKVPRVELWNEESIRQPENILLMGELKERKSNVHGGWVYEERPSEINEVLSVISEEARRRLVCIMNEHKFVLEALNGLEKNDFASFARAVNKSHENMRTNYDISCPEIDWILKRVKELDTGSDYVRNPVNCGRITGKGFGRAAYTVLQAEDVDKFKEKLQEYERIFGWTAECLEVESADGVKYL